MPSLAATAALLAATAAAAWAVQASAAVGPCGGAAGASCEEEGGAAEHSSLLQLKGSSQSRVQSVPANSVLIVIDMQNDFINGSLTVPGGESIINNINSLVALPGWHAVVYTMDYHPHNHVSFAVNSPFNNQPFDSVNVSYNSQGQLCGKEYADMYSGSALADCGAENVASEFAQELWPVHCVQGTWGQKLDARLHALIGAYYVKKGITTVVDSYGAVENNFLFMSKNLNESNEYDDDIFDENTLHTILRDENVKNVYVAGLALDYCVKYTALQVRGMNLQTYLVEDAVKPVDRQQGQQAIKKLQESGVKLVKTHDLLGS